jgi:pimeloyl-ACP methyl ester carboxylesterase
MKKKGFVHLNRQEIYYEHYLHEATDVHTVVLLHEGLGSVELWKLFPQEIFEKSGLNVLVYDRSGYGKSSEAPNYYPTDYLRFEAEVVLPQLLNSLSISKCHLLGHSDGGTIALLYAAKYPAQTISVISEAAHVVIEEISRNGIAAIKEQYNIKFQKALQKYHGKKADWVFYHWADTWLNEAFYHWNMIAELKQIQCPVLAIQGVDDEYGSKLQLDLIEEWCGGQIYLIPDCGHVPHFQKKEEVLELVLGFLEA